MENQGQQRRVLGIVPARGGSKGIPGKNVRILAGKPLLAYTASAAQGAKTLARVILTTDSPEIAAVGKSVGLDVPFLRPAELGADSTPMIDVVVHALEWAQTSGDHYDAVCLLQPTSPLRTAATIDRCVAALWEREVDSVLSVRPVPTEFNPYWVYFQGEDGLLLPSMGHGEQPPCRQQLPSAYHGDGSVFVARTETVFSQRTLKGRRTLGVVSPAEEAVDLDTEEQWRVLEQRLGTN